MGHLLQSLTAWAWRGRPPSPVPLQGFVTDIKAGCRGLQLNGFRPVM